ncbi:hypothetical protein GYMLUDRAFT_253108 [Collybiopsis luxurians FD-317 M1]|uniref:Uncharacterized protein n=1 Tax=Collybiopsis luxurians FD-317 M1 TaxID=944289 RepID=A0A0D0BXV5_9AGAR|nr:hypothetical protein GYMLUDRAFT_253108 [Collybiopsis luxurians FD-317 M1]
MKAIAAGIAGYSCLVSAEEVSVTPPKTSGALCDGFNHTQLVANAWKDQFSATTNFGRTGE